MNREKKFAKKKAEETKKLFQSTEIEAGIIHWDGKIIADSVTCKKVDRLPILISNNQIEKILDVPALEDGKSVTIAKATYDALYEWGLTNSIKGLCCDTTNTNLGSRNGAAVILEQLLDCDLLYLACRHHIFEIILKSCYEAKLPGTTGPDVELFKSFKSNWVNLDKTKYKSGLAGKRLNKKLSSKILEIDKFIQEYLKEQLPRDDYAELLLLSRIFLGTASAEEVKFYKPGACHHARWMSKANYTLKIYLFREQLDMSKEDEKNLFDVCLFIVFIYLKVWFTAPLAIKAPTNDLQLIKDLVDYESVDSKIATCALKKLKNHLWYLSPELSAISLFDDKLPNLVKKKMVDAMTNTNDDETNDLPKKFFVKKWEDLRTLKNTNIDYFVNNESLRLLDRFSINKEFLELDVNEWLENKNYLKGMKVFKSLRVVNDCSERAVHLATEFINILAKNED